MNQLKNEVKVVFLDAGGVLFETFVKGNDRIRNLLMERGYPESKIEAAILMGEQYKRENMVFVTNWNEEKLWFEGLYRTIAKEIGDNELTHELFYFAHYASHCQLFPEVIGVLEALSKKYRLGIISNAMPSMDWIFDRLGIRKYFDSFILSATVKEAKPDEAIYNIALNQLQTKKGEYIFVDDKIENIEGAERVGIKGFHLDREKQDLLTLLKEQELL